MTSQRSPIPQVILGAGLGAILVFLIYHFVFPIVFAGIRPTIEPVVVRPAPVVTSSVLVLATTVSEPPLPTPIAALPSAAASPPVASPRRPHRTPAAFPAISPTGAQPMPIPTSIDQESPEPTAISSLRSSSAGRPIWAQRRDRSIQESPLAGDGSVASIIVSKSKRVLRAFSAGGSCLLTSACTVGRDGTDRATPEGAYRVGGSGVWRDPCHYPSSRLAAEEGYPENPVPPWRAYWPARTRADGNPNSLGAAWIGLVYQADGRTDIGIHGTNEPDMIGTDASHGCVRLPNDTVLNLARRVQVGVTHVSVEP